jgi:hypothetical protein
VTDAQTTAASGFGGPVYLRVPAGTELGSGEITVAGALAMPRFVHGETDPADWEAWLDAAEVPWAEVETEHLALVNGIEFANGTIEVELAGVPAPGAPGFARGFVGVAFRVQPDAEHYDCLYLRPSNGRAPEQIRRNHSTQYIAHPDWPWYRLRAESPGHYESYVDLVPGDWTPVKIVVEGERAELYVGGAAQPTLVVADLKSGPAGKGKVALWIHASTVGHFRNLRITPR